MPLCGTRNNGACGTMFRELAQSWNKLFGITPKRIGAKTNWPRRFPATAII
jgi:hypothetical protein